MVEDTNPEKEGTRIHNVTLSRDLDTGATFVLVSAGMGGVKTGACLDYSEKIMSTYPNEKVFWRESLKSPVQFTKIQNFGYKIFIEKDYDLVFRDIKKNKVFTPEVFYFKTFRELVKLSKCETLNVVFFKNLKKWKGFIEYLNNIFGWHTIVIDEIEDVFPSGASGREWHWMQKAGDTIKHCRRGLTTIIGNVHKGRAIDYRILDKVMIQLYGFGSKPPSQSRIVRHCLDRISKGEFWIEEEYTRFGFIKIKTYYMPSEETWTISEK